jgi:dTDP-4-dehydrorhamnose reductase
MILLLGATTYIGQAFARVLRGRKDLFIPLSRKAFDYTRFEFLFDYVHKIKPDLVINAAEFSERSNGDSSDAGRMAMLQTNTLLPQTIARVCAMTKTTLGHVSSGSIYSGAKIVERGSLRVEEDLGGPTARELFASHPERFCGFTELDSPNSSFRSMPCSFYSGTKALAEEALRSTGSYIWRLHHPFSQRDDPNNFLSHLKDGQRFHDSISSLSHLEDCVGACLQLWEHRAPVGTYNVTNPGPMRTHEVVQLIKRFVKPTIGEPRLLLYENEPSAPSESNGRPNCILDVAKLVSAGIKMRSARQALQHCLRNWEPLGQPTTV